MLSLLREMARMRKKRLLKWLCLIICLYTTYSIIFQARNDSVDIPKAVRQTSFKNHFVVFSTIYYNTSKLYFPNSMIILLNTDRHIKPEKVTFNCYSKNETNTISTPLQVRMAHNDPAINCKLEFFIANCSTVLNPTYFGLTSSYSIKTTDIATLDYELPVYANYPVVMCYAPMIYESRWQQLIYTTEMYHYFGVDLQVQYVNSAMKQIMDILKIYEAKKWLKIQEFPYFDFDLETVAKLGFNPTKEIISRNQHLGLTDCVMRYRESAEFIIIADIDEILFPKENNYYEEFSKWAKIHPRASAFTYLRSYAKIDTPNEFSNFSLSKTIESLRVSKSFFMGKSILVTKNVETAWIHWPGIGKGKPVTINPKKSRIYHVQIAAEKVRSIKNVVRLGEAEKLKSLKPFMPLQKGEIQAVNANFISSFGNIANFKSNNIYADIIFECFKKHENWRPEDACYTPFQCKIPSNVSNFECEVVRRNFTTQITGGNFVFYSFKSSNYWVKNKDKCEIFVE